MIPEMILYVKRYFRNGFCVAKKSTNSLCKTQKSILSPTLYRNISKNFKVFKHIYKKKRLHKAGV